MDLEKICGERRHENMVAYSKEVKVPLTTSKKVVLISANNYDTVFSLKQYVSIFIGLFGISYRLLFGIISSHTKAKSFERPIKKDSINSRSKYSHF